MYELNSYYEMAKTFGAFSSVGFSGLVTGCGVRFRYAGFVLFLLVHENNENRNNYNIILGVVLYRTFRGTLLCIIVIVGPRLADAYRTLRSAYLILFRLLYWKYFPLNAKSSSDRSDYYE